LSDPSTLDQLVSEAGINLRVTREEFRSGLEQGCGICVPFYKIVEGRRADDKTRCFEVFSGANPNGDGEILVRNYYATICPEGGPYDLEAITVSALGAEERDNISTVYDVYADYGITSTAPSLLSLRVGECSV
jgi:hypothetical protein